MQWTLSGYSSSSCRILDIQACQSLKVISAEKVLLFYSGITPTPITFKKQTLSYWQA